MAQAETPPIAFMSYAHIDDENDYGHITQLCERLSKAVQAQTGAPFKIFQDNKSIAWGENWKQRITDSLNAVTFFIPVVSPSFLSSPHCRSELTQFLRREQHLERTDLMLPIFYLGDPTEMEVHHEGYNVIEAICSHQWVDWRNRRLLSVTDLEIRQQLAILAKYIDSALRRTANSVKSRSQGESAAQPRRMSKGEEQAPLGSFLNSARGSNDPRFLLETAMKRKKEGQYQAAKELHNEMVQMGIDWTQDISLFVDHLYFAISLHDKLEDWAELDNLERLVFSGAFARIKPLITTDAYKTVRTMYQSSMALSMLRQLRISDAQTRIDEVLANPPEPLLLLPSEPPLPESIASAQILYANALITRALILHTKWSLEERDRSDLKNARADVDAGETIYRKFARMGQPDEFHHLGRFYGTRAFLRIAEWKSAGGSSTLAAEALLTDAERAHCGEQRTAYGRVAGRYCEAYCHVALSELATDAVSKQAHLDSAFNLLKSARESLEQSAKLARAKITGLAAWIASQANGGDAKSDATALEAAHQQAIAALAERESSLLRSIARERWLGTPLN